MYAMVKINHRISTYVDRYCYVVSFVRQLYNSRCIKKHAAQSTKASQGFLPRSRVVCIKQRKICWVMGQITNVRSQEVGRRMVLRRELLVSLHFSYSVYYYSGNDRLPTTPSFSLFLLLSQLIHTTLQIQIQPSSQKDKPKRI